MIPPTRMVKATSTALPVIIASPRTPVTSASGAKPLGSSSLLELVNITVDFVKEPVATAAGRIGRSLDRFVAFNVNVPFNVVFMRHFTLL
jgi:hypothetical protein